MGDVQNKRLGGDAGGLPKSTVAPDELAVGGSGGSGGASVTRVVVGIVAGRPESIVQVYVAVTGRADSGYRRETNERTIDRTNETGRAIGIGTSDHEDGGRVDWSARR